MDYKLDLENEVSDYNELILLKSIFSNSLPLIHAKNLNKNILLLSKQITNKVKTISNINLKIDEILQKIDEQLQKIGPITMENIKKEYESINIL